MTLNIPISEGGTNSSHTHNLAKFQNYQRSKFLPSDTKFMNTCSPTIKVKKISACLWLVCATYLSVNDAKFQHFHWKVSSVGT